MFIDYYLLNKDYIIKILKYMRPFEEYKLFFEALLDEYTFDEYLDDRLSDILEDLDCKRAYTDNYRLGTIFREFVANRLLFLMCKMFNVKTSEEIEEEEILLKAVLIMINRRSLNSIKDVTYEEYKFIKRCLEDKDLI